MDLPNLTRLWEGKTADFAGESRGVWRVYLCQRCGGLITAAAPDYDETVTEMYPAATDIDLAIPDRARTYLQQALNSLHSAAGAVMLAASAVDAMLKSRGFKDGTLYSRIDQAAANHLITPDMAAWAHEVRLDANDQRHADESAALPTAADAKRCVEFALALGQFMFVLPARIQRGLADAKKELE